MKKRLETKEIKFTLTDMDDARGTFAGYASIFDVVDSYGDIVVRGAFKKTLREKKQFPILWSHNIMEPLGVIRGQEDERGLADLGSVGDGILADLAERGGGGQGVVVEQALVGE